MNSKNLKKLNASDPLQNSVEDNWQLLKDPIQEQFLSTFHPNLLELSWINAAFKHKTKLRKHLYDKASEQIAILIGVVINRLEMKLTFTL